jgi:uncharacterized protein YbjT (DUF2867 family)
MPVLVTGAETGLGRATVRALAGAGGEVRAYLDAEVAGDEEAAELRRWGCKTALGTIDDEGRLELALEQVHTVVHCWGGPLTGPGAELDGVAGALSAALGAGCRRFVWASHLGADDPAGVAYLAACAEAEALLADATLESIVLRRSLTYGEDDELTRRLAGSAVRPDALHAPLALGDLAGAIARADLLRSVREVNVVVELGGPETLTFAEIAAALGAGKAPLPATTVALYDRDLLPGPAALRGRSRLPR